MFSTCSIWLVYTYNKINNPQLELDRNKRWKSKWKSHNTENETKSKNVGKKEKKKKKKKISSMSTRSVDEGGSRSEGGHLSAPAPSAARIRPWSCSPALFSRRS